MYDIPILFVFFNRPEVVEESFNVLCKLKPKKLYLSCDGPRINNTSDRELIEKCRNSVLNRINWDCELHTRFLENNIGCSLGVSTAIDWMFENEEYGIILEDDCIAGKDFFVFVSELLIQYKNDERIGMIAGYNQLKSYETDNSYVFSKYKACWGWATWKRAWKNMDLSMEWMNTGIKKSTILNNGYKGKDYRYWIYRIKLIKLKRVSAWDWQWYFSLAKNNQLCIFPKCNLISNIGFGENSTHTSGKCNEEYMVRGVIEFPLKHPDSVLPDFTFDRKFYKKNNSLYYRLVMLIPIDLKFFIKRIFGR